MQHVEKSIVVEASVGLVYEQWLRFEDFPRFMVALREVRRLGENQFYWRGQHGGQAFESVAEVTLQIPERRIAWRSVSGANSSGVVCFEAKSDGQTEISLKMVYAPDAGWQEPKALEDRLTRSLANFKDLIEKSVIEELVKANPQGF